MSTSRTIRAALSTATLIVLAACTSDSSVGPTPVRQGSIVIAAVANIVFPFDDLTLHAVVRDGDGREVPNASIQWSSADTTIVTFTSAGVAVALNPGTALVTARSGDLTGTLALTVSPLTVKRVAVLGVPDTLGSGDVLPFLVRAYGEGERNVYGRPLNLASSNPAVALIDSAGRIRAVAAGTTTISSTVDGVTGVKSVVVAADPAILILRQLGDSRLPTLIAADSVQWGGAREHHEVYLESGKLQLSGGSTPRYGTDLHYAEYAVITDGAGQRRLVLRAAWDDRDRGLVNYDARGELALTSEVVSPLSHVAIVVADGFSMQYRIAGTDSVLSLYFRREPK